MASRKPNDNKLPFWMASISRMAPLMASKAASGRKKSSSRIRRFFNPLIGI
jgi:hypothetical protein